MASAAGPNLGLVSGWNVGEGGWGPSMNTNLKKLDAVVALSVISAVVAAPPASPTAGMRYIVPAGATGAWLNQANNIAVYESGAWTFYTPVRGWIAENQATGGMLKFNGTAWVNLETVIPFTHANNPGAVTIANGTAFVKLPLYTAVENATGEWSASAYTFTPTVSGLYLVTALVRPVRSGTNPMASGVNMRLGFGPAASLADSVDVVGDTSTDTNPFTLTFSKVMRLTAGTAYCLSVNHTNTSAVAFTYADLKLARLGA